MVRRVVALLVAALVPILLVSGCGSGKPKPKATVASAPATTTTSTPHAQAPKHRAKAAARHHAAKQHVAAKHAHHQHHTTSTTARTTTAPTTTASTTTSAPPATSTITLDLVGRSGDTTSRVCGAPHHYRTYATGQVIGVSGRVSPIPSARWKVKVKIKVCSGPVFTDYVKFDATINKHHGTFSGSFTAPTAGFYEARAELYVNDVQTVVSTDEHFKTH